MTTISATQELTKALPDTMQNLKRILSHDEDECRPLLLYLLDRVNRNELSWISMGVFAGSQQEDLNAYSRLRLCTLMSILSSSYGTLYPLNEQADDYLNCLTFEELSKHFQVSRVPRSVIPYAIEVINADAEGRACDAFPSTPFSLDILLALANQVAVWHSDMVSQAAERANRERCYSMDEIRGYIKQALVALYALYESEVELAGERVAIDAVRRMTQAPVLF